jgi:hypothetical protein
LPEVATGGIHETADAESWSARDHRCVVPQAVPKEKEEAGKFDLSASLSTQQAGETPPQPTGRVDAHFIRAQ